MSSSVRTDTFAQRKVGQTCKHTESDSVRQWSEAVWPFPSAGKANACQCLNLWDRTWFIKSDILTSPKHMQPKQNCKMCLKVSQRLIVKISFVSQALFSAFCWHWHTCLGSQIHPRSRLLSFSAVCWDKSRLACHIPCQITARKCPVTANWLLISVRLLVNSECRVHTVEHLCFLYVQTTFSDSQFCVSDLHRCKWTYCQRFIFINHALQLPLYIPWSSNISHDCDT